MGRKVVIIGNGISGVTAARYIRKKSDYDITIISSETEYFFSRTALMYVYMGHMPFKDTSPYEPFFWEKNRIELVYDHVEKINFSKKLLLLRQKEPLQYDTLILALGSKPNTFDWPGQNLPGVQGLYSYQDLELLEQNTSKGMNRGVIVGGGLIGIELAEMLHSRNFPVTFLVREGTFWGSVLPKPQGDMIIKHIKEDYHIDLKLNTELKEIVAGENGRVHKIVTKNNIEIECDLVGLSVGVHPNVSFLKGTALEVDKGVLVNEYLETNIDHVYAVGDCAQFHQHPTGRKNIEQVWYTGKMMGQTVAQSITGKRTAYKPGNWFNSAKFFDIEYQTYGWVSPVPGEQEEIFYWQKENEYKSLYFVFDKENSALKGVNSFGIRLRHELFDRWLTQGKSIEYVLEHLSDANFDPEFYRTYEKDIIKSYNQKFNKDLKPKKKSWKRILNIS